MDDLNRAPIPVTNQEQIARKKKQPVENNKEVLEIQNIKANITWIKMTPDKRVKKDTEQKCKEMNKMEENNEMSIDPRNLTST